MAKPHCVRRCDCERQVLRRAELPLEKCLREDFTLEEDDLEIFGPCLAPRGIERKREVERAEDGILARSGNCRRRWALRAHDPPATQTSFELLARILNF